MARFDIKIMSSDIQIMSKRKQNQLLQLILKSRHKAINKMDLKRDRNYSYWKLNNSQQTTELKLISC